MNPSEYYSHAIKLLFPLDQSESDADNNQDDRHDTSSNYAPGDTGSL